MPRGRTRAIAVTAIFASLQVALGVTGVGTVPLPPVGSLGGSNVTILEIPAILAGVLGGALPGALVGAVFGAFAFTRATTPLFQNALIAIAPRVFVGLIGYGAYRALRPVNRVLALAGAGALGALANTGLVLALAVALRAPDGTPYLPANVAWDVLRATAPADIVIAALATVIVGSLVAALDRGAR